MRIRRQSEQHYCILILTLGAIVLAFMGLSLAITATGTARFAVAMGYRAVVIIGCAWVGLVTYSSLATHATLSTAIATIERTGSWKMEIRSDTQSELAAIEKRLEVLSQPVPPRPSKSQIC